MNLLNGFLSLFYPAECPTCKRYIKNFKYGHVCPECFSGIKWITGRFCSVCGLPLASPHADICRECGKERRYFDRVRSAGVYGGALKDMIAALKFGGKSKTARILADHMLENLRQEFSAGSFIVPVPAGKEALALRGYNQTELLSRALAKKTGLKVLRAMAKLRETQPQRKLEKKDRAKNVRGAYGVVCDVSGLNLIVVDDVCTTASTLNEAAKVLKKAGAVTVTGVTAARAV